MFCFILLIFAFSNSFFSSPKTFRKKEAFHFSVVWLNEDRHHNSLSNHKSHLWAPLFTGLSSQMSAFPLLSLLKQDQIHRNRPFDSYSFLWISPSTDRTRAVFWFRALEIDIARIGVPITKARHKAVVNSSCWD